MKNPVNKRTLGILSVSALLGVGLLPAGFAQDADPSAERPGRFGAGIMRGGFGGRDQILRGRGERGPERFMERLDSDGDAQVSSAEYLDAQLQRVDAMFERRDANGDGLLSREETTARERGERRREGRRGGPGPDRQAIAACMRETIADYGPDGASTLEERFDANDTNNDGQLSLAEVSSALEARALQQFARLDIDGNGLLTESDLSEHLAARQAEREELRDCIRATRREAMPMP